MDVDFFCLVSFLFECGYFVSFRYYIVTQNKVFCYFFANSLGRINS